MGFKLTYKRFFSVSVRDTDNNVIRSLEFTPTPECIDLLNKHHLVYRNATNGFEVFYRSNPNASDPITSPIEEKTKFSFSVKIRDVSFYDLYKPDVLKIPQFYLSNLTAHGNISEVAKLNVAANFDVKDLAIIKPHSFTQQTDMTVDDPPPNSWIIKKKFIPQDTLKTIPIDNSNGSDFVQVRMNDPLLTPDEYIDEEGVYALDTDIGSFEETTLYLSNTLGSMSINGVLEIYRQKSQDEAPDPSGKEYEIIFKLK